MEQYFKSRKPRMYGIKSSFLSFPDFEFELVYSQIMLNTGRYSQLN